MESECQVPNCNKKDIQFIMVRNSTAPMINHKEYYCPNHLRMRAFQLEILKLSGKMKKKLNGGWW